MGGIYLSRELIAKISSSIEYPAWRCLKASSGRSILIVCLYTLLSACGKTNVKEPEPKPVPDVARVPQKTEPVSKAPESASKRIENTLLKRAEIAFRAGQLTTPPHNNAYDSFQSVLIINPGNTQARSGVQAILLRYAELLRGAITKGRLLYAEGLLRQAETYYPANPLLMDIKRELIREKGREEETLLAGVPKSAPGMEYPLPGGALARKSPTVSAYLGRIAERIRESDESVMIYARNDREGRWIYSQLKKAVPGYRVRGDIRISRKAKISILPPLQ